MEKYPPKNSAKILIPTNKLSNAITKNNMKIVGNQYVIFDVLGYFLFKKGLPFPKAKVCLKNC